MRLLTHVTQESYRDLISDTADGRVPIAWLIYGSVTGHGWGFLRPWEWKQLFPAKGTQFSSRSTDHPHEPFWVLRIRPWWGEAQHPNHEWPIEGRYWRGLVWRQSWGYKRLFWRFKIWAWRSAFLDPDIVTRDPHQDETGFGGW